MPPPEYRRFSRTSGEDDTSVGTPTFGLGSSIAAAQTTFSNLMRIRMWRAFFTASSLVLLPFASSHASSFDGAWSVLQVCDSREEGGRRYRWRYDDTVKRGQLVGHYRL